MRAKQVLTTGEIARYCGVNFRTVIRWIERGQLKAYQLPGRGDNRVAIQDFLDFLAEHKMPIPDDFAHHRRRVLIVEDEPHMSKSIQRVLQREGFETLVASDGFRAGTLLGTFAPSVMTLDLKIPGLSGLDVLTFVRSTQGLENVKILVVSAMPKEDLEQALATGADDMLQKPFTNEELLEKVTNLANLDGSTARSDRKELSVTY